jgi:hypothetical protein
MHRSSETIGAIATALAKAQSELTNPEKSVNATIRSPFPREQERSFRYAPLSSGLDIVRKTLGRHEIAAVQSTEIDKEAGFIRLTTILAHSSGEWISSEWPVCPVAETAAPHRMGAALTYARRYALFTLVGIAGEDDLDAPGLHGEPSASGTVGSGSETRSPTHALRRLPDGKGPNGPLLEPNGSASLRDKLLNELAGITNTDDAAQWAHKTLARKSTLVEADARLIEDAFAIRIAIMGSSETPINATRPAPAATGTDLEGHAAPSTRAAPQGSNGAIAEARNQGIDKSTLAIGAPRRHRDKAHLSFVASFPCVVCGRRPTDPHHVHFAQLPALGRKVSDEYAVPLCRSHHRDLHRSGNEHSWWQNLRIDPLQIARGLWQKTRSQSGAIQPGSRKGAADIPALG